MTTGNTFAAIDMRRATLSLVFALLIALTAHAADDPAPTGSKSTPAAAELDTIVVTGSYLRRTDTETPSPVQVISAEEIEKSGKPTVADVIRSVSAHAARVWGLRRRRSGRGRRQRLLQCRVPPPGLHQPERSRFLPQQSGFAGV